MRALGSLFGLFWLALSHCVAADQVTIHVTGMGVGQSVDHNRPLVSILDFTANSMFDHRDPTVGLIVLRMPKNEIREALSDAEFRQIYEQGLRDAVHQHWQAGRRDFEIHILQDNTLLKHGFHAFSDIQDDVAKFSRAAYGATGDIIARLQNEGHEISVDASLGSNDTAGFVLAHEAWRSYAPLIRRVTLVDGRAPLKQVRESLDILGGSRVRIINSHFDAPAAPDYLGVFQNIAYLGNSEKLAAEYPGLQVLWVRQTQNYVAFSGHIRTLVKPEEAFDVELYLGGGHYAEIGRYTGRDIHPILRHSDYVTMSDLPPVGNGTQELRGPIYNRHAVMLLDPQTVYDLGKTLTLLMEWQKALASQDSAGALPDLLAVVNGLHRDFNTGSDAKARSLSAETIFAMARLGIELTGTPYGTEAGGTLGLIEGMMRLDRSIGDPEGWTLVFDAFSDLSGAAAGINPLQLKVTREGLRALTRPTIERLWYDLTGVATQIENQAMQRQALRLAAGQEPLPLDQLLGPQELSVVGHWRAARFNSRWNLRRSPKARVTASVRRVHSSCTAGRCRSVTLASGSVRVVGIYSSELKQQALQKARINAGLTNLAAIAPAPPRPRSVSAAPLRPVGILPDLCEMNGEICKPRKRDRRHVLGCDEGDGGSAAGGDDDGACGAPMAYPPFFFPPGPGGDLIRGGGDDPPQYGDWFDDDDPPPPPPPDGEQPGPTATGPNEPPKQGAGHRQFPEQKGGPGGVLITPTFSKGPSDRAAAVRNLLAGCDFSTSATCDLSP